MKRIIIILTIFFLYLGSMYAQEPRFIFDNDSLNQELNAAPQRPDIPTPPQGGNSSQDSLSRDSLNKVLPDIPSWRIDTRFGDRIMVEMDTLFNGYHQKSLVDGQDVAVGYLGNWGSPAQSKIFFSREESSQFGFLDAFKYYNKTPSNHTFLDMKQPFSNFTYHSGGGRQSKEEFFTGMMSLSFNKHFTLGFDIDYLYSRGFYNYLSNKQTNYSIFSSYITDKYKMHAIFIQNNYTNVENGGIAIDSTLVLNDIDSKEVPVNFGSTWNKLRGRQFYMNHKISIGHNETEKFIPVASIIWASHYADQKRSFTSDVTSTLDKFYNFQPTGSSDNETTNTSDLNDRMSYYSFKNSLSISLNEGFRDWVKFGLIGFIEHDIRKYTMPGLAYTSLTANEYSQNSTVIGGQLAKQKGKYLRYNLYADLGVLGYNQGESRIKANVTTQFKIKDRDVIVQANAYWKTLKPVFYELNYFSRYYNWASSSTIEEKKGNYDEETIAKITPKDFDNIGRTYIGGEIYIPSTKTRLSGGVENIKNYIYYNKANDASNVEITQLKDNNIQVLALKLDQKLNAGVLHFDNQAVLQKTLSKNNDYDVIPLPLWSIYSNLYLQFKIAAVLDVQFGLDTRLHTKYYASGYDPALLQFYNQHERKIGGFPISTLYANFHLKKTRFFVMMYNVGTLITDKNYFVLDQYAINPMVFKFGLSWNFTN